jgi:hypothetical protein
MTNGLATVAHSRISQLTPIHDLIITDKMRAILIKDDKCPSENLYLGEAPTPTLRPTEVLVQARNGFIATTLK